MTRNTRALSYCSVALISAVFSSFVTWQGSKLVAQALAQTPPAGGNGQLLTQPLPDLPGREVRITLLDRAPGNSSPPHQHPGHHTFGYVIQGTYQFGVNNQPARILKAGDVFYEPPGAIHSVSRNASASDPLKIIVFMVADQRNPSTVNQ